jgi:hypothetical protein
VQLLELFNKCWVRLSTAIDLVQLIESLDKRFWNIATTIGTKIWTG